MNIFPFLLQILSGAIGGFLAGAAFEKISLGPIGNTLAGIVGGSFGGQIFQYLAQANPARATDISTFLISVAGGWIGGVGMLVITGWIKNAISGKS